MHTNMVIGLLALGAAGGFPLGRWWADTARASHDIARSGTAAPTTAAGDTSNPHLRSRGR
jgi:hypothetical protein